MIKESVVTSLKCAMGSERCFWVWECWLAWEFSRRLCRRNR